MTALAEPGRAMRGGVRSFVSSSISSAMMTARKLRALIANAAATPNAAMVSPASAGPMIREPLNMAELSATALPMSSRPTSSMAKDLADRHVQRRSRSRAGWRAGRSSRPATSPVTVSTARTTARTIITTWVATSVWRLGRASAATPANRPKDHHRDELRGRHDAEPDGIAGELEDQPRLGDLLHPRPDE